MTEIEWIVSYSEPLLNSICALYFRVDAYLVWLETSYFFLLLMKSLMTEINGRRPVKQEICTRIAKKVCSSSSSQSPHTIFFSCAKWNKSEPWVTKTILCIRHNKCFESKLYPHTTNNLQSICCAVKDWIRIT